MKVIYLAGMGRSGSTILESVLGAHDGCVATGEVCFLWDRGLELNRLCGCGEAFDACPFWSDVMRVVRNDVGPLDAGVGGWFSRYGSNRALPRLVYERVTGSRSAGLDAYLTTLDALYRAIGEVTGARVIVDSSKFPGYGVLLDALPSLDVYPVHLVRDGRAVSNSCRKTRIYEQGRDTVWMKRHSLAGSLLRWYVYNLATELCGRLLDRRPLRVRYESFVERPPAVVEEILRFVGEHPGTERVIHDGSVELSRRHMVSGNPSRFLVGRQLIRRDDSWRRQLGAARSAVATTVTYPLLRRYGYAIRPGVEGAA